MKKYQLFGLFLVIFSLNSVGQINPTWEQWIKNNSHSVLIKDTNDFHDLSFLNEILKDKKIVFLGENSHGVSEFTLLKSRMIRYLHDKLGFDVLVFETNAADAFAANMDVPSTSALKSIYNTISSSWHVEEILPLFNYVKKTHSTMNPLELAGVDITLSNGGYSFSRHLYNLLLPIDATYAKEVLKFDSTFARLGVRQWTIGNILSNDEKKYRNEFEVTQLKSYSTLINFLEKNKDKLPQQDNNKLLESTKYYVQTRIDYIYWMMNDSMYMVNKMRLVNSKMNLAKLRSNYRDYMMTQNLKFLVEKRYPGKRVIVWSQDAHIKKRMYRMPSDTSYSKYAYTIGVFCYSGKGNYAQALDGSNPDSMIYTFKTPKDSNSIENIIHLSGYENTFVDLLSQKKIQGNTWIFDTSKYSQWDGNEIEEVVNIRNAYDGLLLLNKINSPKYLKFNYEYLLNK